jgi:hypothetical protein
MSEESGTDRKPSDDKDAWDKLRAAGPVAVALVVGVMGAWFNLQQAELERHSRHQQVFTELLAQRERADSDLRSATFKTLFDHYFKEGSLKDTELIEAASNPQRFVALTGAVKQRIMFLELLGRNFETIDIKPLFENLDLRLTNIIKNGGKENPSFAQLEAFRQREILRKVGRSLGGKQATALASLDETKTQLVGITSCPDKDILKAKYGKVEKAENKLVNLVQENLILIVADKIEGENVKVMNAKFGDGKVRLSLEIPSSKNNEPPSFSVGFYESPYLDNTRFSSDARLAVVLEKFIAPKQYARFLTRIESGSLRDDYLRYQEDLPEGCEYAAVRVLLFPEGYMGLRDRPYVEEILLKMREQPDS